ncbi:hypothetical protein V2O64_08565 [Verrucomicrobiaceae bacterium 227]
MKLPILAFIILGVVFATRWVINPPDSIQKYPRRLRFGLLIIVSWIGTFVFSAIERDLGSYLNNGIAYDGAADLPYDVVHDGVGDNVVNLFLGWISGFIFLALANAIHGLRKKSAN